MERREDPSMEEYPSSNPYITDNGVPVMPLDGFVADGFRPGGGGPRLPMVVVNPYITNTTETTADMAVTDGYFNGRPHQQLPLVHLPDEDPVKTAMPEPIPREQTDENGVAQITSPRQSQEDDRQTVYSRVSFGSERSTLPPSYTSRPMSRRVSYEEEEREGDVEHGQTTEIRPLIMGECLCRHPQCISCVANGTAYRDREERCSWRRRLRCARGCTRGVAKKRSRKFRFCCASIFFLIFTWTLFGGLVWKNATSRFKESMEYIPSSQQCGSMLPGVYDETFTVPINTSLSSFSLRQSVVYDKPRDTYGSRINVDGTVFLERASRDDDLEGDKARVTVQYMVTDETVLRDIDIKMTGNGVSIHTNAYSTKPVDGQTDVCVLFTVTVMFPRHASTTEISQLLIDTEQLDIKLRPSLSLKVLDKALLNTITGFVWSEARQPTKIQDDEKLRSANFGLQAKNLLIGTTTGRISGVWGLADSASFESQSGNIDIGVSSITSFSEKAPQTDFTVSTVSGDIAIHSVSTDGALHPFRKDLTKYNTVVKTISGHIIGQYLLGSSLSIQSISGDIRADILPISPASAGSTQEDRITFDTDTKSGRTFVSFLEATDARILTEPQALLKNRAVQTVLIWIEDKKRKIWQLIQKHCADHEDKPHADAKSGHAGHVGASQLEADIEPLYVDPQDVGLANLSFFTATHNTVSGEVFVHYSAAFEGTVKATTLTGDIEVGGENVKIVRNSRNGPVGRVVEAVHGNSQDGFVESKTISGDIKICIGDSRW